MVREMQRTQQDIRKLDKMLAEKARLAQELAPPPAYIREGHFRFMDLPAELRTYIYSFLLPQKMDISFRFLFLRSSRPEWVTLAKPRGGKKNVTTGEGKAVTMGYDPAKKRRHSDGMYVHSSGWLSVETQVLRVSKAIESEAKAVLYGSNIYRFGVSGDAHYPISLHSTYIFGPFGADLTNRLPLLRNLRIIHLDVTIDEDTLWAAKRHFSRLEYFVSVLKQHTDDANRRSLLEELTIKMHDSRFTHILGNVNYHTKPLMDVERYMFGLEPLAQLTGVKNVQVEGVSEWFAECLQIAIIGKGCELKECEWPVVKFKKSLKGMSRKWEWQEKSVRKWWQPRMNWREFAERNGVECPDDVDKFWMTVD